MVKNLSCASHGSLKRFPHKFTTDSVVSKEGDPEFEINNECVW